MRARGVRPIIPARAAAVFQAGRESARGQRTVLSQLAHHATRPGERAGCGIVVTLAALPRES